MAKKHLKIKRPGMGSVTLRKSPFAVWLDEQPRAELTYEKGLPRLDEKGWSAEDMAYEAKARGVEGVRVQTVYSRRHGRVPNSEIVHAHRKAFPTIQY